MNIVQLWKKREIKKNPHRPPLSLSLSLVFGADEKWFLLFVQTLY